MPQTVAEKSKRCRVSRALSEEKLEDFVSAILRTLTRHGTTMPSRAGRRSESHTRSALPSVTSHWQRRRILVPVSCLRSTSHADRGSGRPQDVVPHIQGASARPLPLAILQAPRGLNVSHPKALRAPPALVVGATPRWQECSSDSQCIVFLYTSQHRRW